VGKHSEGKKGKVKADPALVEKVKAEAVDGKLACHKAFALAEKFGVPIRKIGDACDVGDVRIVSCQLGCF
jgi:hypothetical protein